MDLHRQLHRPSFTDGGSTSRQPKMAEKLDCSFDATCTWASTADKDDPKAQQEYTAHFVLKHGTARVRDKPKPKPIDRPTVGMGCSPADYNDFERRWGQYKQDTGLPTDQ